MRTIFILDELKVIRNALYTERAKRLLNKDNLVDERQKNFAEDEVVEVDKILLYVNELIRSAE